MWWTFLSFLHYLSYPLLVTGPFGGGAENLTKTVSF